MLLDQVARQGKHPMTQIRTIEQRHRGYNHGDIRRLISPNDLGQRLKPFVFLDFVSIEINKEWGFGFHPHSGIATLTYHPYADIQYEDTSGQKGLVRAGGLEWMLAGGGVWHKASLQARGKVSGFQLWVTLPPDIEDGPSQGQYVPPENVPRASNVNVLLGSYAHQNSPIHTPTPINYFDLSLTQGEDWSYQPPDDHQIAWLFVYQGKIQASGEPLTDELVIFDETDGMLVLKAITDARILIGTAVKHNYPLVLGSSSVHTNPTSLEKGMIRIREIGTQLHAQGRI